MRNSSSEVVDRTAEAVSDVDAVRLPPEPVERTVVATAVRAELTSAGLRQRVVRVIDAYERCADTARCVVNHLKKMKIKVIKINIINMIIIILLA